MTTYPTKKATDYIDPKQGDLTFILQKVKQLKQINQEFAQYLPPNIKRKCQVANIANNQLILLVEDGTTATQLRFMLTDLLQHLKNNPKLSHIKQIEYKVRPKQTSSRLEITTSSNQVQQLSKETAQMVTEIAQSLDDRALREVLERIAKHTD